MIIPDVQMAINKVNNLGFTAFFNMIKPAVFNHVEKEIGRAHV